MKQTTKTTTHLTKKSIGISQEEKDFLKKVKTYKDYMLYLLYLLQAKNIDMSADKHIFTSSNRKRFRLPTILERFYIKSLHDYIAITDDYYYKYSIENKSIKERIIGNLGRDNIHISNSRTIQKRVGLHLRQDYGSIYYLFLYIKIRYNIEISDTLLYFLSSISIIPPAILVYAKLHAGSQINRLKKKQFDWHVVFAGNKIFRETIEKLEPILKKV